MTGPARVCGALALALVATAPAPGATLVVANKTDNTVDLLDAATGRSAVTLPTGHAPHEVAVSRDGSVAVISDYGHRDKPGTSLTVIDVPAGKVLHTVDLWRHTRPHGLCWISSESLAVTTEGSSHVLVVDPRAGRIVREIETAQDISHMIVATRDGKRGFVANIGSGSVTVVDFEAGRKIRDIATGDGAEGIAVSPDGTKVWVSNRSADTLSVIDTTTLEIEATLPCPGFPIRVAFTPDGKRALVSCARGGEVALFDVASRSELLRRKLDLATAPDASRRLFGDRFGESPVPVGLVVAPDGKRGFVAATQADAVVVVDPAGLEVLDLYKAGREPDGMALSPLDVSAGK